MQAMLGCEDVEKLKYFIPAVHVSGFSDSNTNPSYYAGTSLLRRFMLTNDKHGMHFDAGAIAFFMTREDYHNNRPFFGVLPMASIGNEHVALNITYIPKVHPKMVRLFYLQLKVKIF